MITPMHQWGTCNTPKFANPPLYVYQFHPLSPICQRNECPDVVFKICNAIQESARARIDINVHDRSHGESSGIVPNSAQELLLKAGGRRARAVFGKASGFAPPGLVGLPRARLPPTRRGRARLAQIQRYKAILKNNKQELSC